jgi:Na+/proline symporter
MWMAFGIGALPAQEIYQRIFSAHSEKAAKNGVFLSALLLFIISSVPLVIGLGAATLHPELMGVDHGQNLIPEMVLKYASLPLQILLYGAIISAILSTPSGAMLSPATIIGENLLKPRVKGMTDKQLLLVTRISVVVVAVISCIVAFNNVNIHGLVVSSAVLMLVCLFAPLAFGLYWKKASSTGAWAAILLGGVTWVLCNYLETLVAPTIYGTLASCMGMMAGSMLRPDPFAVHNQVND